MSRKSVLIEELSRSKILPDDMMFLSRVKDYVFED